VLLALVLATLVWLAPKLRLGRRFAAETSAAP
jgi:hypothetical protein